VTATVIRAHARVPMLWILLEQLHLFGPALSKSMHEAYTGRRNAEYHLFPRFGNTDTSCRLAADSVVGGLCGTIPASIGEIGSGR